MKCQIRKWTTTLTLPKLTCFNFRQRKNIVNSNSGKSPYVEMVFPSSTISPAFIQHRGCDYESLFTTPHPSKEKKLCQSFANHGHCISGKKCPQSHDIDLIVLSKEVSSKSNNRKRKRCLSQNCHIELENSEESNNENGTVSNGVGSDHDRLSVTSSDGSNLSSASQHNPVDKPGNSGTAGSGSGMNCGGHRAGFDAFMTGFRYKEF